VAVTYLFMVHYKAQGLIHLSAVISLLNKFEITPVWGLLTCCLWKWIFHGNILRQLSETTRRPLGLLAPQIITWNWGSVFCNIMPTSAWPAQLVLSYTADCLPVTV
jgi:hypothetical protein